MHKESYIMSQVVNMRYPKELLKRIDGFKEKKGFITRTQTIIYLIQYALEQSDNLDSKNYPLSEGDSSLSYLVEDGVFSPNSDRILYYLLYRCHVKYLQFVI